MTDIEGNLVRVPFACDIARAFQGSVGERQRELRKMYSTEGVVGPMLGGAPINMTHELCLDVAVLEQYNKLANPQDFYTADDWAAWSEVDPLLFEQACQFCDELFTRAEQQKKTERLEKPETDSDAPSPPVEPTPTS